MKMPDWLAIGLCFVVWAVITVELVVLWWTMKFRITFKSPDAVSDSIEEAIEAFEPMEDNLVTKEDIEYFVSKWVTHSEYITIEFDTEAKTAIVIPKG